ncbi:MAG TPA: glycosyltransferase, partial [bacterium]|nr:glycosyltransferase [bacterium]
LIIFTDYIKREELIKLYNSALFFIYISLYEGFGLPVIEAFGCGCPVITSDIEVIKEITDNAALLVNPEDLDDIKTKIDLMYENENIRNNYIKLGLQRAEFYKTDNSVMQLLSLYRKSKL